MQKELLEKHGLKVLTIKQKEALIKILEFSKKNGGLFPSLRDTKVLLERSSVSEADRYYQVLIKKGYLEPITNDQGIRMSRGCRVSPGLVSALAEITGATADVS